MNAGILLLGIGIGAATTVFVVLWGLLIWEPDPQAEMIEVEAES